MKDFRGEAFLHQLFPNLHTSFYVEQEQKRRKKNGEKTSQIPSEKISIWLKTIKNIHQRYHTDQRTKRKITLSYYNKFVIKTEDFPVGYFEQYLIRERNAGMGDIVLSSDNRSDLISQVVYNQQDSLSHWIDYLLSRDADMFPFWVKFWIFTSLVKLSSYKKDNHTFFRRTKNTTSSFPELNREALSQVVEKILVIVNSNNKSTLGICNFGRLYASFLNQSKQKEERQLKNTQGSWIKYTQGSDCTQLVNSIAGLNTGWCTASESMAGYQLDQGDFYVYYSLDSDNEPRIPRVAIRMESSDIAEIRGISYDQNLDPYIGSVLEEKLNTFGERGNLYLKKVDHMKYLTLIEEKQRSNEELTKSDLRFLYEIDFQIEGFGYDRDPRIQKLKGSLEVLQDLMKIFQCSRNEISTSKEEALSGGIKYHIGDLNLDNFTSDKNLFIPEIISGSLYLNNLLSIQNLKLPQNIGENLSLNKIEKLNGVKLPEFLGCSLMLENLKEIKNVQFPEHIHGSLNLNKLEKIHRVSLPRYIDGTLNLKSLKSAKGVLLPERINYNLDLNNLITTEGLKLPRHLEGGLYLNSLIKIETLKMPEYFDGVLSMDNLKMAKNIYFPEFFKSDIALKQLKSVEKLYLPIELEGNLDLGNLETFTYLKLPRTIEGFLSLEKIAQPEGIVLPRKISDSLFLGKLESARGLIFPGELDGFLDLNSLETVEGLELPKYIGKSLFLRSLTSTTGTKLPEYVGGTFYLGDISSTGKEIKSCSWRWYTNTRDPDAESVCLRGLEAFHAKEYDKALDSFEEALGLRSKDFTIFDDDGYAHNFKSDIYKYMGDTYKALNNFEYALSMYQKACNFAENGTESELYMNQGSILFEMKDYQKALITLEKSIELKTENPDVYKLTGLIFEIQNKHIEGIDAYKKAHKLKQELLINKYDESNTIFDFAS